MMNLKISDINVGDVFIEEKKLGGYDYFVGKEFEVKKVVEDESAILLSLKTQKNIPGMLSFIQLYLSIDELNNYFVKPKKFVWGDWKEVDETRCKYSESYNPYFYKTNGKVVYVKTTWHGKVFKCKAACHEEDLENFDLNYGIDLALKRVEQKINIVSQEQKKEIVESLKVGDRVKTIWDNERPVNFVYNNATGTIARIAGTSLVVKWDIGKAKEDGMDRSWWIEANEIEKISFEQETEDKSKFQLFELNGDIFNQPVNYTVLHTLYGHCNGEAVGLSKKLIDTFDIKEELVEELNFLKDLVDYYDNASELVGEIITYPYKNIITLITKEYRRDIVQYSAIRKGLKKVKNYMEENNIHYLAMPRICCGYEGLEWEKVKDIINEVFADCKIPITIRVCHQEY